MNEKYDKDEFVFMSSNHIHGTYKVESISNFVKVDSAYSYKEIYLLKEVYEAFLIMATAAKTDSLELKIISAARSFDYQKKLWENKWTGKTKVDGKKLSQTIKDYFQRAKKILEYTAPPGFSRHHWGTDIDINSVETEYFDSIEGQKIYTWLQLNAPKFGFCQTYNAKELRNGLGFCEEKWHWSYTKLADPIIQELINQYQTEDIKDFMGFREVRKLSLLQDYILSINKCQ
ncbi:MAG: M15 family metallopeptidase [Saprospiraceae bacterium]